MKKSLTIAFALVAFAIFAFQQGGGRTTIRYAPEVAPRVREQTRAVQQFTDGSQIQGQGVVTKMLPDDNDGSRHQRFILQLDSGQTLLVAHNIDLAQRLPAIQIGDLVEFYGEYAWNEQGGVVHWTHRDPGRRHVDGWLRHRGQIYQ